MLIRSQDNKKLVNINRVLQLDIEEYRKDRGYYYSKSYDMGEQCFVIHAGTCPVGEYSNMETVMMVLDMIEQHYAEFQKSVLCPSMYPCKPIFQMPEEEEIPMD